MTTKKSRKKAKKSRKGKKAARKASTAKRGAKRHTLHAGMNAIKRIPAAKRLAKAGLKVAGVKLAPRKGAKAAKKKAAKKGRKKAAKK